MDMQKPGSRSFVPCDDANVPELWENETINFELSKCDISFDSSIGSLGTGKLYITSKRLIWIGETVDQAFDYDIAYIGLHAVSRDAESYPKPCVYIQFDVDENDQDDEDIESEAYLVPENEADIMSLFDALSHAALLNPDPEEDDDEFVGDFVFNPDEVNLGAEQARRLNHLESVFHLPGDEDEEGYDGEEGYEEGENGEEEQYEDAEEETEGENKEPTQE